MQRLRRKLHAALGRARRFSRHPLKTVRVRRYRASGYRRLYGPITTLVGIHPYQPLFGVDDTDAPAVRPTHSRWAAIEAHLPPPPGSALDVGCLNGFFCFKMAERGHFAVGVDSSIREIQTARHLAIHNRSERAAFARLDVTPDSAQTLPDFDVVVCLSVFHHLVRLHNIGYATEVMHVLAGKARRQLYFETGQVNETNMSWASDLAFMGHEPESWVADFVSSLGFDRVRRIARTPGFSGGPARVLILGERK